jgi:glycosyltransferase involved in cell wall biosynthesis
MQKYGIKSEIVWLFRPQDYWIAKRLNPEYLCYHITDKYNTMLVNTKNKKGAIKLDELETKILKLADIVFCTARSLWEKISLQHERTVYVGNVADVQHFSQADNPETQIPPDIAELPHPIIGFFGAIDSFKLDYNLIKVTAKTFSKGSVVLIGPIRNPEHSKQVKIPIAKNIHYLGTKGYSSLPSYLKGFDICIIPYLDSEYTRHVFPLKFFEYLATGKPVVSTPLPSLNDFDNLYYKARNVKEWVRALKLAISENLEDKKIERKKKSYENSWNVRVSQIESCLDDLLNKN